MRCFPLPIAVVCLALVPAGCGGGEITAAGEGDTGDPPEGGVLSYALDSGAAELDPLLASDRSSLVVTRQIHEPLVETLSGPFGDVRELPGLAHRSRPSRDRSIWSFQLRRGVRFQDGRAFNAAAVLANAERWRATATGREILPDLVAVDAPRPDFVRFVLSRPDRSLPLRLADGRLGLVSPRALRGSPSRSRLREESARSGTGAFEFRERDGESALTLARNTEWWGTRLDLGPALDQVVFAIVPDPEERARLLADGDVQIADGLPAGVRAEVRADPLLTVEGGSGLASERSVRGVRFERGLPVLSGAWLTTVGRGG